MALDFLGDIWDTVTGRSDENVGLGRQEEMRNRQKAAIDRVGGWALTGQGPSAAQEMVRRNRAENAASQVGMAKTLGGDPALANRMAAEGIARGDAEASFQGEVLRAQEQQAMIQNYLNALDAARGQDLQIYGQIQQTRGQNAQWLMNYVKTMYGSGAATAGAAA